MSEQILQALRDGAYEHALALARAGTDADPGAAEAQRLLALALSAGGDRAAALQAIDAAIVAAPERADLHLQRAGYLLGDREIEQAKAALSQTVSLDPNQFVAYVMQAQLAIGLGDLETASQNATLAARVAPEHPWVLAAQGMVALHGNDGARALSLLHAAAERAPEDPQVLHGLVFAYLANGHLAFAEQAIRRLGARQPMGDALRALLVQVLERQNRLDEACDEAAVLVGAQARPSPALLRQSGLLALGARREAQARDWLRGALEADPRDPLALDALMEAWRRLEAADEARTVLAALTAAHPEVDRAWLARLALEPLGGDAARAIIDAWVAALPAHPPALDALMAWHALAGDEAGADAVAERIVAIEPGRVGAERRVVEALMRTDPDAAIAHVRALVAATPAGSTRFAVVNWLGLLLDRLERHEEAAATWMAAHAEVEAQAVPLPAPTAAPADGWTLPAFRQAPGPAQMLLYGPPGSGVEQCAALLAALPAFRIDRAGTQPPQDPLQNVHTAARLASGELQPAEVADAWRAALPARGLADGSVLDWLPLWDNALLPAFAAEAGPQVPLLFVLRDPRDMLLDWIAFGFLVPLRLSPLNAAADWLAAHLQQLAALDAAAAQAGQSSGVRIVRSDEAIGDPQRLADLLGPAVGVQLPVPEVQALGQARFPAGYWRRYADALAEPFARLSAVAATLGYPAQP